MECDFQPNLIFFYLNELECRLIAPRLAFQKIYQAPRGGQLKINGNVVNVPADVNSTVNMLPRLADDTGTIKVQLKRRLQYNRDENQFVIDIFHLSLPYFPSNTQKYVYLIKLNSVFKVVSSQKVIVMSINLYNLQLAGSLYFPVRLAQYSSKAGSTFPVRLTQYSSKAGSTFPVRLAQYPSKAGSIFQHRVHEEPRRGTTHTCLKKPSVRANLLQDMYAK